MCMEWKCGFSMRFFSQNNGAMLFFQNIRYLIHGGDSSSSSVRCRLWTNNHSTDADGRSQQSKRTCVWIIPAGRCVATLAFLGLRDNCYNCDNCVTTD